jgi:hypothetical protein
LSALSAFSESYPRSAAPKRLALDIATGRLERHRNIALTRAGEKFRELTKTYLVSGLERGVPSLFVDVKGVYIDAERMRMVGEIVEEIIFQLEKDSSLHDDGAS